MRVRTDAEINKIISRARDAYQEHDLIEKKINDWRDACLIAMVETTTTQDHERKNLWQALHIADKVLEYLTQDITDGKLAVKYVEEVKRVGKPTILERILP